MKTTFYYDLIDDGGISTIELPIKLYLGTIFEHEFGTYEVIKKPKEAPEDYISIPCERVQSAKDRDRINNTQSDLRKYPLTPEDCFKKYPESFGNVKEKG